MTWPTHRRNVCARCQEPCALQHDDAARCVPEARCVLKRWQTLPPGITGGFPQPLVPATAKKAAPEAWGPPKWAALHEWALASATDAAERARWLRAFAAGLPGCDCRSHWRAMLAGHPPPLAADNATLFAWTVERHNEVNARKGKPIIGLAEALSIWSN